MKPQFYSHLVQIDIEQDLESIELTRQEKQELIKIAHSNLHHAILDAILSELSEKDKRTFLSHLADNDHDKTWKHLNTKIEGVEEKIQKTAENLKRELQKDIQKVKTP